MTRIDPFDTTAAPCRPTDIDPIDQTAALRRPSDIDPFATGDEP